MTAAKLRKALLAWPGVTEDIKWGHDQVWSVGGKMFCVLPDDASTGQCFKVPDEDFLATALWHLLTTVEIGGRMLLPPFFFSNPFDVAARIYKMFATGQVWRHLCPG